MSKRAEISFSYYKQGSDLNAAVASVDGDAAQGLEAFAVNAESVAAHARAIKKVIDAHPQVKEVTVDGDTHCCWIEGPTDLINDLIAKGLAQNEFDEEEEFEDEEDDD